MNGCSYRKPFKSGSLCVVGAVLPCVPALKQVLHAHTFGLCTLLPCLFGCHLLCTLVVP